MEPQAVVFDLFGTLIDDSPPSGYVAFLAETARLLGADPIAFGAAWERRDVERYTSPIEEVFETICDDLGLADRSRVPAALAFRLERLRTLLVPRPDAESTLASLRERGFRLGMISNASSELSALLAGQRLRAALRRGALRRTTERTMKPYWSLYERMAVLLVFKPAACVFVGDGAYHELQGAAAAGMRPVLIRVPHDEWEHDGTIGWDGPRVSSLSEV